MVLNKQDVYVGFVSRAQLGSEECLWQKFVCARDVSPKLQKHGTLRSLSQGNGAGIGCFGMAFWQEFGAAALGGVAVGVAVLGTPEMELGIQRAALSWVLKMHWLLGGLLLLGE